MSRDPLGWAERQGAHRSTMSGPQWTPPIPAPFPDASSPFSCRNAYDTSGLRSLSKLL